MVLDYIINELLVAGDILQTNNVTRIASELGYQPLLIINALNEGNKSGRLVYNRKRDTVEPGKDVTVSKLFLSEGARELGGQLELFVADLNSRQGDIWITRLSEFIPGTTELQVKLAIRSNKNLATYDLKDPRDKKSVYTFLTLKENMIEQWGLKQFTEPKKKKK